MRFAGLLTALILLLASCGEDRVTNGDAEDSKWPDRTEEEDIIEIIEMIYNDNRDMEKYRGILLEPEPASSSFPDGYIWHNAVTDTYFCGKSYDYLEDCKGTEWILQNADSVYLSLYHGTWAELDSLRGMPCEGCRVTERRYHFYITVPPNPHDIYFNSGSMAVRVIIGPERGSPDRYVIYQAEDFNPEIEGSRGAISGERPIVSVDQQSWGEIKSLWKID